MVLAVVKPFSISFGTATILVVIESAFLGSLPALALFSTFVGPFIPLGVSALNRRRTLSEEDSRELFQPLFTELVKNRDSILSARKSGYLPEFQRGTLDNIRLSARYSLLKERIPTVETLCANMDVVSRRGDAFRSANSVIAESIAETLGSTGGGVNFQGRSREGNFANFESAWIPDLVIQGLDPLDHYRKQGFEVNNMGIVEKGGNTVKSSLALPQDEAKFQTFLKSVETKAKEDPDIKTVRDALAVLPNLAKDSVSEVIKEIEKSRRIY